MRQDPIFPKLDVYIFHDSQNIQLHNASFALVPLYLEPMGAEINPS